MPTATGQTSPTSASSATSDLDGAGGHPGLWQETGLRTRGVGAGSCLGATGDTGEEASLVTGGVGILWPAAPAAAQGLSAAPSRCKGRRGPECHSPHTCARTRLPGGHGGPCCCPTPAPTPCPSLPPTTGLPRPSSALSVVTASALWIDPGFSRGGDLREGAVTGVPPAPPGGPGCRCPPRGPAQLPQAQEQAWKGRAGPEPRRQGSLPRCASCPRGRGSRAR